jgi:hypothetical protein
MVDGEPIEGVQAVEYRTQQSRENVYALGSEERIGLISGSKSAEGRLKVSSTSSQLDALTGQAQFQITAQLKHGDTQMTVTFDECFMLEKSYEMGVGSMGEAVYSFTATRVREELG